jgi:putative ABC transport system permease protein
MRRRQALADLDRDIEDHLARETEIGIERGLSPEEARTAALRAFGNVTLAKESTREVWFVRCWQEFQQDVRYGVRALRRSPGFTLVALLALGLGVGANTVVFSAVNGVLIEHLPYADASRLFTIRRAQAAYDISVAEARTIASECPAINRLAIYDESFSLVLGGARPERRSVTRVTADFFPVLGVQPVLGRSILPEDVAANRPLVAVLSFRFWMDGFGGDPGVLGREVLVYSHSYTVVGVMPKTFELGIDWLGETSEGFWVPLTPASAPGPGPERGGTIVAHLAPGAGLATAQAQLSVLSATFAKTFPSKARGVELVASAPGLSIAPAVRIGLLILLGAVGCVLLMASVNVSALLVARARTRARELAIRTALGAGRLRIVRQLMTESLLLAVGGGVLGLTGSVWGTRVLAALAPHNMPRVDRIQIDRHVLWFTVAVSLLTCVSFGLLPAIQASSRRIGYALKQGLGQSFTDSPRGHRHSVRSVLVVIEIALAAVLLVGGTLMARSFYRLMQIDTGVRADHVLTMSVQPSTLFCDVGKDNWRSFCLPAVRNLLDAMRAVPGVDKVGLSTGGALRGGFMAGDTGVVVEGVDDRQGYRGAEREVTPEFFATMGIRFLAGRDFTAEDITNRAAAVVVSDSFARRYIPGPPLGRRFSVADDSSGHHVWNEIVGVVNDVRDRAVGDARDQDPPYYRPFQYESRFMIAVRTSTDPATVAGAIEHVVSSMDPHAPMTNIETMDQMLVDSSAQPRFVAVVMGSFSGMALLLAVIGIYGVISYATLQRTHEIGVRVALGAQPADVMRLVIAQGAALAGTGIACGLAGALALTRFLRSLLFEVAPTDPATFAGVTVVLFAVALAACWIPARRAAHIDPRQALAAE